MLPQEALFSAPRARRRLSLLRAEMPSPAMRLIVRVRGISLDERLLAGEDPSGSAALTARAVQLTAPRSREQLADALRGLLRAAERPRRRGAVSPNPSVLPRSGIDVSAGGSFALPDGSWFHGRRDAS